jgi:hypothetical protein
LNFLHRVEIRQPFYLRMRLKERRMIGESQCEPKYPPTQ